MWWNYWASPTRGVKAGNAISTEVKGRFCEVWQRAPYFHNGAAEDLNEIVNFYNQRFQMNLTDQEKSNLVAFLNSL